MRIGPYDILPVHAGTFRLDGGAMFGVVPRTLWERTNPPDEQNRIEMAMRCLLVRGNHRVLLVDAGAGSKLDEKSRAIYAIDHSEHELVASLAAHGVEPAEVTDVIVTHLHFDHCGGLTRREGDALTLQFPRARHLLQRRQWEHALDPSDRDRASFLPENFLLLEEKGRLELLEGDTTVAPGIEVLVVNGHTPAQQLVTVRDDRKTLFYCADLVPTASHLPDPYIMGYDLEPLETLAEKKRILPRAAEEGWVLLFEHDPRTEAATIRRSKKHFEIEKTLLLDEPS